MRNNLSVRSIVPTLSLLAWVLGPVLIASASDAVPGPTTTAPSIEGFTVTGVKGTVQVRCSDTEPWVKPVKGMSLPKEATFRLGPRSALRFASPDGQTVVADRLGTSRFEDAAKLDDRHSHAVSGGTTYEVAGPGIEHVAKIRTPGATLSIRSCPVRIDPPHFDEDEEGLLSLSWVWFTVRAAWFIHPW